MIGMKAEIVAPTLNVLSLFAGIGGFDLGLERAGMRVVANCEISPVCRHLLKHHWPEVRQYDDICTLTADQIKVICGGFPCQDISVSNPNAVGIDGARSGLWSANPKARSSATTPRSLKRRMPRPPCGRPRAACASCLQGMSAFSTLTTAPSFGRKIPPMPKGPTVGSAPPTPSV